MTGCRVRVMESTTLVCVECKTAKGRDVQEARCLRIVQLMDEESLSLDKAEAQVKSELEAKSFFEAEQYEKEQNMLAVRRITISWPEFAVEDVGAALQEACDDEDAAIDLL